MSRIRPGVARDIRWILRWEPGWLLVAAGVGGLVVLALEVWAVPERHRWDVVAAAVTLVAIGLSLLTTPGTGTARPRRGPGRRRRATRRG